MHGASVSLDHSFFHTERAPQPFTVPLNQNPHLYDDIVDEFLKFHLRSYFRLLSRLSVRVPGVSCYLQKI